MCGIVVVIGSNSYQKTKKYLNTIKHRGPNYSNIVSIDDISIGFVRLAINDKTIKGNQLFETDKYIGVFNAEIYNHKELIKKYNLNIKSKCDTEVMLPLFEKLNYHFLEELDGFYSGVIIDKKTKEIIVIRDYLGKKPFFFAYDKNNKYIVSEMKVLPTINHFEIIPLGLSTLNNNKIKKLYSHKNTIQHSIKELKNIFYDAVYKRIKDIGNFGVFLSGGLDSSIVATLISQSPFSNKAHYYYIANDQYDDYKYIRNLQKYLKINNNAITEVKLPTTKELEQLLNKVVYATESRNPSIVSNGLGSFLLSQQANKDDIKVVVTGDGADEMFLGYTNKNQLSKTDNWREHRNKFLSDLHITELRRIDLTCMNNSVEVRCPFLDKNIYHIANKLNYFDFFGEKSNSLNKNILRIIFKNNLPIEIINRKKVSFDVGSGLQKIIFDFCQTLNISEQDYLDKLWDKHFNKTLSLVSKHKYFWSYPQFNKVIATRGKKWL